MYEQERLTQGTKYTVTFDGTNSFAMPGPNPRRRAFMLPPSWDNSTPIFMYTTPDVSLPPVIVIPQTAPTMLMTRRDWGDILLGQFYLFCSAPIAYSFYELVDLPE